MAAPMPPPPVAPRDPDSKRWWHRALPVWSVILIAVLALVIGTAAAGDSSDVDAEQIATSGDTDETEVELASAEAELEDREREIAQLAEQIDELETDLADAREPDPTTTTTTTSTTTTQPPTTTTTTPPQPVEVAFHEGVVDTQTPNFSIPDGWELRWDAPGGLGCVFYVRELSGRTYGDIDSEDQPQGSSYFRDGGTYYLDVKCYGADYWKVWAVDTP